MFVLQFFIELAYCHQWITGEAPGTQLDASLCTVDFDVKVFRDDFVKDPTLFYLSSTAFNVPIKAFQEIVNVSVTCLFFFVYCCLLFVYCIYCHCAGDKGDNS